ncbi:MAG: hypothetical protein ACR2GY_03545 [Phycisphaerales bacterium]
MSWTHKSHGWDRKRLPGPDPFQHWYRDNQVYFITARCRDGYAVFATFLCGVPYKRYDERDKKGQGT